MHYTVLARKVPEFDDVRSLSQLKKLPIGKTSRNGNFILSIDFISIMGNTIGEPAIVLSSLFLRRNREFQTQIIKHRRQGNQIQAGRCHRFWMRRILRSINRHHLGFSNMTQGKQDLFLSAIFEKCFQISRRRSRILKRLD